MWQRNRTLVIWLISIFILLIAVNLIQGNPDWIEYGYSQSFYPVYAYLPKILFGWLPFSIGDLLYVSLGATLLILFLKPIILLFRRQGRLAMRRFLVFLGVLFSVYLFFQVAWAMNYYRIPVSKQLKLNVDTVYLEDHLSILADHIAKANQLRAQVNMREQKRDSANIEVEQLMREDAQFPMLSKTQVKVKYPLVGVMASYFGVSGYFNPFSNEAHVNGNMPLYSYPFTVAHELSHQMGIGFEDECNFIAFVKLQDHPNPWYAYAAYLESSTYLLRSLYLVDKGKFEEYKLRFSAAVKADLQADQAYWQQYTGWINTLSGMFYNQYLIHNNQAEGMARYGMVSRLIIAWEKQKKAAN